MTVTIRGTEPALTYEIFRNDRFAAGNADDERPLAVCGDGGQLQLPEGSYRVQVAGPPGSTVRTSGNTVELNGDAQLTVAPASQSLRTTGLVVGAVGSAFVPAGAVVILLGLWANSVDRVWGGQSHGDEVIYVGLGMAVVGGLLAAGGWITFAMNNKPKIDVMPRKSIEKSSLRVGPARLGSGWGLSGSIAF